MQNVKCKTQNAKWNGRALGIALMVCGVVSSASAQERPDATKKAYELDRTEWMKGSFGVMTHYLLAWQSRENNLPMTREQWIKMTDAFDAEGLAEQIKSTGAKYHLITIGQGTTHLLTPSPKFDELFTTTSNCATRDVIADIAAANAKRGIITMVYSTCGGPGQARQFGSTEGNPPGDYRNKERMRAWESVLREWSLRWGDSVAGWWFDGCYTPNRTFQYYDEPNFESFAAAVRAGNPKAAITFNRGVMDRPISITPFEDYTGGEINDINTVRPWRVAEDGKVDGARLHMLSYLGEKWGIGEPRYADLNDIVLPYTLRIVEMGGAVTWDVPVQPSGLIEAKYVEQLKAIGKAVNDRPQGTLAELTADRNNRTRAALNSIKLMLEEFNKDLGRYPTAEEGLPALIVMPADLDKMKWKGPYIRELGKDPFGGKYKYARPGRRGAAFEVMSPGADLEFGTRDDLSVASE